VTLTLRRYRRWFFDCDGVLLDSNGVKTDAFRALAQPWGEERASALVAYHQQTGGVSRFVKVRTFVEELLGRRGDEGLVEALLTRYGELVRERLFVAPVTPGTKELLASLPKEALAFVVSGGLEVEVQEALTRKGLASYFAGVYGSPRTKDELVEMIGREHGTADGVFFGDAAYDAEVAERFGLEFVFVSRFSEATLVANVREVDTLADVQLSPEPDV
jgi:phosphoglycolate phosphatase-like HAD superfamily hydrolase